MSASHPGHVLPQDITPPDGWGEMNAAQPVSSAEIEDLLYGEDRPVEERLARLGLHMREVDFAGVRAAELGVADARFGLAVTGELAVEPRGLARAQDLRDAFDGDWMLGMMRHVFIDNL